MRLIKTSAGYINPDHVVLVDSAPFTGRTIIRVSDGTVLAVNDSVERTVAMLEAETGD